MKSEYFVLLPNDICCSLQSFAAIALKSKTLWRKICHSKMLWYQLRSHLNNAMFKRFWTIISLGAPETGQCSHQTVYLAWSCTRKMMHKVLWQRKRNFLQNIWILIGCLSAMLSFGTWNGNRGGFTVCNCTVKNNLGILVVVFIPKRTIF